MADTEAHVSGTFTLGTHTDVDFNSSASSSEEEDSAGPPEDLVPHRMIVNGRRESIGRRHSIDPTEPPKVLEMSCTSENITGDTADFEKYSSKLVETTSIDEDGIIVKDRVYEESAIKAHSEKTDSADVSSSSQMKFQEREKICQGEEGTDVAEYDARCEEKHSTEVSTTEKVGESEVTRTKKAQKSLTKTCKRIEEVEGDVVYDVGVEEDSDMKEDYDTTAIERNEVEGSITRKSEKTVKSEKSETKIIGDPGDTAVLDKYEKLLSSSGGKGTLIDLGGTLGQVDISPEITSPDKGDKLQHGLDELDVSDSYKHEKHEAVKSKEHVIKVQKQQQHGRPDSDSLTNGEASLEEVKASRSEHAHLESRAEAGEASRSSRRSAGSSYTKHRINMATAAVDQDIQSDIQENELPLRHQRQTRHLEEDEEAELSSRLARKYEQQEFSSKRMEEEELRHREEIHSGKHREEDVSLERDKGPAFRPRNRGTADDLVQRILAESRGEPCPPRANVDMGEDLDDDAYGSLHSDSTLTGEQSIGSVRKRGTFSEEEKSDETRSLLDRRLEAVAAAGSKLDKIFGSVSSDTSELISGASRGKGGFYAEEEYHEESIIRKKKGKGNDYEYEDSPFVAVERKKGKKDALDEEIDDMRSKYAENAEKRYRAIYAAQDDEDERQGYGASRMQRGRRLMRQDYHMDADDYEDRPPEPDYIPDEEFIPQRRDETDERVKEKSKEISQVVERQTSVLKKLKEASNSFDDLQDEIKQIKQAFLERQASSAGLYGDDDDDEPSPGGPGRYQRKYGKSQSLDYSPGGYTPYVPGSYVRGSYGRTRATMDSEQDDNILTGKGLSSVASRYSSMNEEESSSSYMSSRNRYNKSYGDRYGRSRSLYDDLIGMADDGSEEKGYRRRENNEPQDDEGSERGSERGSDRGSARGSYNSYGRSSDYGATSSPSRYTPSSYTTDFDRTPRFSSRFSEKPKFTRSNTLSDFDFDHSTTNSGFSSRFLNKVRQDRGGSGSQEVKSRDKPFKSRFLRSTFDAGSTETSSTSALSSKRSSYVSKRSASSAMETTSNSASTSGIGSSASSDTSTKTDDVTTTDAGVTQATKEE